VLLLLLLLLLQRCKYGMTTAGLGAGVKESDCGIAPGFGYEAGAYYNMTIMECPIGEFFCACGACGWLRHVLASGGLCNLWLAGCRICLCTLWLDGCLAA
jgi:hypothetical protein